jgi:hypothetical protein
VGAVSLNDYIKKSEDFKGLVLADHTIVPTSVPGATPNVFRYRTGGQYIDLVHFDNGGKGIISFGSL